MLLIIFYGEFCCFNWPVMPRLESHLNNREFKLNSYQKLEEDKQCREEACNPGNFAWVTKFFNLSEISQPANLAALVVDFFFLYSFLSLPNLSLFNSDSLLIFWYIVYAVWHICQRQDFIIIH